MASKPKKQEEPKDVGYSYGVAPDDTPSVPEKEDN